MLGVGFFNSKSRINVRVLDYTEHALTAGRDAEAASYLEIEIGERVLALLGGPAG